MNEATNEEIKKSIDERMELLSSAWKEVRPQSTGWRLDHNFTGTLYNVSGSAPDPKIPGYSSWKKLLENGGKLKGKRCYVTDVEAPEDSSHDNFDAGGHMTKNSDGSVPVGSESYLMPICAWHNYPGRKDGYSIQGNQVIVLSGFLQKADTYATFFARLPVYEHKLYGLVFRNEEDGFWRHKDLTENEASLVNNQNYPRHILIKKSDSNESDCTVINDCIL